MIRDKVLQLAAALSIALLGIVVGYSTAPRDHIIEVPTYSISQTEYTKLTEWQLLEMAIIKTESDYNSLARGTHDDLGIFQGTAIWVEDVNRILGSPTYSHIDCFSPDKSLVMFNVLQDHYNPTHDIYKAIKQHNPGGDSIDYSIKVLRNMDWIKRYEDIRYRVSIYSKENE